MNFVKPYLRSNYVNKNNQFPVCIKVKINNQIRLISLNIYIDKKYWDYKKNIISSKHNDHIFLNKIIEHNVKKIEEYVFKSDVNSIIPDFNIIKELISGKKQKEKTDFFEFAEKVYNEKKNSTSLGNSRQIFYEIKKIKKFKENIFIEDLDTDFLKAYEKYMITVLNNKNNTVHKTFKKIKMFLNEALKNKIIIKSPFENYKIKYDKTYRNFLSLSELKSLEELYNSNINISTKNVLQCFLFSCYTGLRYSDISLLDINNINDSYINIINKKTKEQNIIPLTQKAKKLINYNSDKPLNVYSNQKCNQYLKLIAQLAGINKELTFHCARHTFAVIALNELNIPINIIQNILGHSDLNTTKIYAKLMDSTKFSEMKKFDNL